MQNLLRTCGRAVIAELSLLEDGWREKERPLFDFHMDLTWPRTEPLNLKEEVGRYEARSYSCDLLQVRYHQPTLPASEGSATKVVWISDPCLAQSVGLESQLNTLHVL